MDNQKIVADASTYYKNQLNDYPYLKQAQYITQKRKYNQNTIATFGIGISSDRNGLVDYLYSLGYDFDTMQKYGLIGTLNEKPIDWLANRFTIEIKDVYGSTIGLVGRTISGDKRYKYLTTKTTPIFVKRKTIFNLDKAKYYIDYINDPYLIIVEGQCDVMSLWQNGIRNVVALMGTSCSEYHAKLIKMFCEKVIICLDGDSAGQKGTERTESTLNKYGIKTYRLLLPDGKDADEIMQIENGKELFLELINKVLKETHNG